MRPAAARWISDEVRARFERYAVTACEVTKCGLWACSACVSATGPNPGSARNSDGSDGELTARTAAEAIRERTLSHFI